MTDYKIVGIPVVTQSGMRRIIEEGMDEGQLVKRIRSYFTKEHPMYKKYGITEMYTFKKPATGWVDYILDADVFNGKRIRGADFYSYDKGIAASKCADFLKSLKRAKKYKPTKFLENVINVAKYIGK